jgi:hypothetical protein
VLEKSRASHVVPQNYVKRNTEAILPQTARPNLIIIFDDIIIVFFFYFSCGHYPCEGMFMFIKERGKFKEGGRNTNNGELGLPQLQVTPTKKNTMTTVLDDLPGLGEPRRSSADSRRYSDQSSRESRWWCPIARPGIGKHIDIYEKERENGADYTSETLTKERERKQKLRRSQITVDTMNCFCWWILIVY